MLIAFQSNTNIFFAVMEHHITFAQKLSENAIKRIVLIERRIDGELQKYFIIN